MAVFTPVSDMEAQQLLTRYAIGDLVSLRGIAAGIENTNYFLTTTKGEFVLTLFEVLTDRELPFYIELMHHLASNGIPVPQPQTMRDGKRLTTLNGKPASIVTRLSGGHEPNPGPDHCVLAARTLARMHLAARDFHIRQPNLRSLPWWKKTIPQVRPFLNADQAELIDTGLQTQIELAQSAPFQQLPTGPAHCDLFRDNVLFDGTFEQPRMGGFIDFYFAGWDTWIFDVAVSVNDWCINRETGEFLPELLEAWLSAYAEVRPFTDAEKECWPLVLQGAALRFWVSRLYDYYLPRPAQTLKPHDPRHFERILRLRMSSSVAVLPE